MKNKALLGGLTVALLVSAACTAAGPANTANTTSTTTTTNVDASSDVFITFGQPVMNDTSPYPYHKSISAWYNTFLKVAVSLPCSFLMFARPRLSEAKVAGPN